MLPYLVAITFMLIMLSASLWLLLSAIGFIQTKRAGAYYVPTPKSVLHNIFGQLNPNENKLLIDLGSGDGRILRFVAKEYGLNAVGYEVVFWPYVEFKIKNWFFLKKHPQLKNKIETKRQSAFEADISQADYVFLYTSPIFSEKITPKLKNELQPGAKIVSLTFPLPDWEPIEEHTVDNMTYWLYEQR